ncbi:MAG: fibrinogen-like YCDxxxxGGGW domain-containing protein, partial [Myxococcota bacterium]|nr:fibrinogen-like YCDxxxxGGGW domain-containing protein [Myxococcota bacterium]
ILSSTATNKGDTWTVTVTPEDPYSVGQSSSQSIEIDNASPSILSIAMVPNSPNNRDTVQCTATATDPDPTDLNSLSTVYQWRNLTSNTLLSNANSLSLSPSLAEVGDVIECTATVTDIDGGIGTTNATVIISNTNPSIGSVNISPATPGVNDSASCTASGIDLDGDSIAMSYEWSSGTNALGSGNTLDLSTTSLQRGDTLTCTATAADGNGGQAIDSTTATIGNSAPEITGVEILVNGTPSGTALAGDTLSCNALGYTDADGDSGQFIYQWKVNGAPTASSASINSGFVRTDVVSCELTPFDGQSFGVSQTAAVTINNSPPVISSVSLSPSSPNINSTITANIVATDLDGDNITYLYSWLVNGTPVYNGTSLTSAYFTQGDNIALEVAPDDGITTGPNVTSSSLFITNSPPSAATLLITPTNPVAEYDDLVCSVLVPSTDSDNDPVSYTMTWLLDGNNFTNSTDTEWPGDTILYTDVQVGDTWTCIATPTDGIDDGVTSTATVTITECTDGSIAECAAQSCLELFQNGQSNGDGGYFLNPNGTNVDEYYCDMQNGGWTGINFTQANDLLGGVMVDVIAASTDGIDTIRGPFTRDGNSNHSYHYTFEFLPGFNEFKFQNYEIKANAGSGDTSDINLNSFVMSSWNKAYGGARGDVGFGTAAQSGPVANLSIDHGTSSNCNSCIYTMSNAIHSIGAVETSFRIGWGESGSEKEGWYPWYDGLILLK